MNVRLTSDQMLRFINVVSLLLLLFSNSICLRTKETFSSIYLSIEGNAPDFNFNSTPIHRHLDALRYPSYQSIAYPPLLLSGRSRHDIDDNFPNSVGERRTHHREVICKNMSVSH